MSDKGDGLISESSVRYQEPMSRREVLLNGTMEDEMNSYELLDDDHVQRLSLEIEKER